MNILKFNLLFLSTISIGGLAKAEEAFVPDKDLIFVQFDLGYCPNPNCQAIFLRKNSQVKKLQPGYYEVYTSNQLLATLPSEISVYNIPKVIGQTYTLIVANSDSKNIYFYKLSNDQSESYFPVSHVHVMAGYDPQSDSKLLQQSKESVPTNYELTYSNSW